MEPNIKAFKGIFIRVEDISTDLMKYIGMSAAHLNTSGSYINVYRVSDGTWHYIALDTKGVVNVTDARGLTVKTSQEVFDFMFDCDLEN